MMKKVLIGGPMLGQRGCLHPTEGPAAIPSKTSFEPLVTPLVGISKRSSTSAVKPERFILLPHGQFIQVLAYSTSRIIGNFVPFTKEKEMAAAVKNDIKIESVCLATYPRKPRNVLDVFDMMATNDNDEDKKQNKISASRKRKSEGEYEDHVILAGCSDGSLREFSLLVLMPTFVSLQQEYSTSNSFGNFELSGPCYTPRRVFQICKNSTVSHLTSPGGVSLSESGLLAYALVEPILKNEAKKSDLSVSLLRLLMPPFYDDSIMECKDVIDLSQQNGKQNTRVQTVDKVNCNVLRDKNGNIHSTTVPFRLESVVRDRDQDLSNPGHENFLQRNVFLVLARSTSLLVYYERLSEIGINGSTATNRTTQHIPPVSFPISDKVKNPLCSMSISVNKKDVACGFFQGDIVIKSNILASVEEYFRALEKYEHERDSIVGKENGRCSSVGGGAKRPDHPSKSIVEARVHWHSHPVTTLCYDPNSPRMDPILYSGGEESVLITWQLSRGINRPAGVMPRLAQRGIVHILCPNRAEGANDSILVYCDDNSLQLIEAHDKGLLWKVQGLAAKRRGQVDQESCNNPSILSPRWSTPTSSQIILNGLPDAPGMLQWYDPRQQRVASDLEIAPYNRVSSLDHKDMTPMPAPCVTHLAMSKSGFDLMTVDKVPTENTFVGSAEKPNNYCNDEFGFVTTVKFWTSADAQGGEGYELVAAMSHPHGTGNRVSAIAMSTNGHYACTVSNDEKAFRLWQKVAGAHDGEEGSSRRLPVWVCRFKVTTPSGYSNHATGKDAVAFSLDSSILAICYGHMITIWDRCNMTLLTSLNHLDNDEPIASIEFVKHDMILCSSPSGVSLQSPFGVQDQTNVGWSWSLPRSSPRMRVSCVQFFGGQDVVAVSVYACAEFISRMIFIDLNTGNLVKGKDGAALVLVVAGKVCSIGKMEEPKNESSWRTDVATEDGKEKAMALALNVLTSEGALIVLRQEQDSDTHLLPVEAHSISSTSVSSIPLLPRAHIGPPRKRRRRVASLPPLGIHDKKLSLVNFGSIVEQDGNSVPLPTNELPSLTGEFARSFVGRNLFRKKESSI